MRAARRIRPVSGIHDAVSNKPSQILPINVSGVEKWSSKEMVISYATSSQALYLATIEIIAAGICKPLDSMTDQATAATSQQPQAKVTALSFAALEEELPRSEPTNQEPLVLRSVKTEHGVSPRQQNP